MKTYTKRCLSILTVLIFLKSEVLVGQAHQVEKGRSQPAHSTWAQYSEQQNAGVHLRTHSAETTIKLAFQTTASRSTYVKYF